MLAQFLDDDRLKRAGQMNYFDELITRIRDIRSSEKVFYQKVKDIYTTSVDYDPDWKPILKQLGKRKSEEKSEPLKIKDQLTTPYSHTAQSSPKSSTPRRFQKPLQRKKIFALILPNKYRILPNEIETDTVSTHLQN